MNAVEMVKVIVSARVIVPTIHGIQCGFNKYKISNVHFMLYIPFIIFIPLNGINKCRTVNALKYHKSCK